MNCRTRQLYEPISVYIIINICMYIYTYPTIMFMYPNLCVLKVVDHRDHTVFGRFAISGHAHIISGWWYTLPL